MMRVLIEIDPFGLDINKEVIETIEIINRGPTPNAESGHPDFIDERYYECKHDEINCRVIHRRRDGAVALTQKALSKIQKLRDQVNE